MAEDCRRWAEQGRLQLLGCEMALIWRSFVLGQLVDQAGAAAIYADLAGAATIYADLPGDFAQVSAESVVARDPDLIALADAYSPYKPQTPAMVAARRGWAQITAVQSGAVYAVQEELVASPSPRLADGLETLAYLVHPDRFAASGGPTCRP